MTNNGNNQTINLADLARQVMIEKGFTPDFPNPVIKEVSSINTPALPPKTEMTRDLRDLLWISIDNDDSKDLDQITSVEMADNSATTVYVAISDVDALVKKGSEIDNCKHCYQQKNSVLKIRQRHLYGCRSIQQQLGEIGYARF